MSVQVIEAQISQLNQQVQTQQTEFNNCMIIASKPLNDIAKTFDLCTRMINMLIQKKNELIEELRKENLELKGKIIQQAK